MCFEALKLLLGTHDDYIKCGLKEIERQWCLAQEINP
jgi:hypothetical protein